MKHGVLAAVLALVSLATGYAQIEPPWWAERGVISASREPNDYEFVSAGQLKWITKQAFEEIDFKTAGFRTRYTEDDRFPPLAERPRLPLALATMIYGTRAYWHTATHPNDPENLFSTGWIIPFETTNDFTVVNVGQVKNIGAHFYSYLAAEGFYQPPPGGNFPWDDSPNPPADFAPANIGQIKQLFSFNYGVVKEAGDPRITEVMSDPRPGSGATIIGTPSKAYDWIEIFTPTGSSPPSNGWKLRHRDGEWTIPDGALSPGSRLLVILDPAGETPSGPTGINIAYADFSLDPVGLSDERFNPSDTRPAGPAGAYLALTSPEDALQQQFFPSLPDTEPNVSYGEITTATWGRFHNSTPGAPNNSSPTTELSNFHAPHVTDLNGLELAGRVFPADVNVKIEHPSLGAEIFFTLDGSDPQGAGGMASATAVSFSTPIQLTVSTHLRARARIHGRWSKLMDEPFLIGHGALRLSKIGYAPAQGVEFIEILNAASAEIDLSQFSVGGHISTIAFAPGEMIPPGGRIYLTSQPSTFGTLYDDIVPDKFSIAAIPDTQYYSLRETVAADSNVGHVGRFRDICKWIAGNISHENIVMVSHVGDIVNNGDMYQSNFEFRQEPHGGLAEWLVADAAMDLIDGRLDIHPDGLVPYSMAVGNHDLDFPQHPTLGDNNTEGPARRYFEFFGPNRYAGRSWYGGFSTHDDTDSANHGRSHYQITRGGGRYVLHITLDWDAPLESMDWANRVMDSLPKMPTVISTHFYRSAGEGSRLDIQTELIDPNPQVFMTLSGHVVGLIAGGPQYNLSLEAVESANELLGQGIQLVIVALVGPDLHVRIFNADGAMVVDKSEQQLVSGANLNYLRSLLTSIPFPDESSFSHLLTEQIIAKAGAVTDHSFAVDPPPLGSGFGSVWHYLNHNALVTDRIRPSGEPVLEVLCDFQRYNYDHLNDGHLILASFDPVGANNVRFDKIKTPAITPQADSTILDRTNEQPPVLGLKEGIDFQLPTEIYGTSPFPVENYSVNFIGRYGPVFDTSDPTIRIVAFSGSLPDTVGEIILFSGGQEIRRISYDVAEVDPSETAGGTLILKNPFRDTGVNSPKSWDKVTEPFK